MPDLDPTRGKFALHGPPVELACSVPAVSEQIHRLFDPFAVTSWPAGFVQTVGIVRPYAAEEVLRHVSPVARPFTGAEDLMEIYQDGDRFWLVDDRWGMAEVNMIRGQFRSWVLPNPRVDAVRCAELAVVWPLAQLLRAKGLYLLPAVSAVRDGWAVLLLCPFTLEAEMVALVRAGYKIIGQRWTAVREEDGRLALLHLPGAVERSVVPRLRSTSDAAAAAPERPGSAWTDLCDAYVGSWQNHAFCDAVLVAEGGRRATADLRDVDPANALNVLRRAWPIIELHPNRRHGQLPAKIAQHTRVCELQLSRHARDLPALLEALRETPPGYLPGQLPGSAAAVVDREMSVSPWPGIRAASAA